MSLTTNALRNPAAAAAMLAIVLVFGAFSLLKLPIQLFPDVENPKINIQTSWRAASPSEMEAEIIEPIEEVLQGLPGVKEMEATANAGFAWINLTFAIETDMQKTMVEVISRMNRLPPLPRDADQPVINLGGWDGGTPALSWFFLQVLPGNDTPVSDYISYVDDVISPAIESVPGVSRAGVQGAGREAEEVQIIFDPYRAAELGISMTDVIQVIGRADNISGGQVDIGRRRFTLRYAGRFDPESLHQQLLEWRDGRPITLGDIAEVKVQLPDRRSLATQNGNPAIGIRVDRENGANALATLNRVKEVIEELNAGPLKERNLVMIQSFDASVFIYRAIGLVTSNLLIGVLLAVGVLWWFLRRFRATLIIALAIPVSLLSTFVVLHLTGRTLNVISLAGLAFAVGMVLDAAIVVLENVVRLREQGRSPFDSAQKGTSQVWGALLASTLTTVAIFIPVVFLKDVEGQLFGDLALTIAIAVSISLITAITVIPLLTSKWLGDIKLEDKHEATWNFLTNKVMAITSTPMKRYALIAVLLTIPIVTTIKLMPELDYLPPVKRDAIDAFFQLPPATNLETINVDVVQKIEERLQPYMNGEKEPALKNYYILLWPNGGTMGVRVKDQSRVKELEEIINKEITADIPDFVSYNGQGDLFGGFGGGRDIPVHIQSNDPKVLEQVAMQAMGWLNEALPEARVRPEPGLQQAEPELRLIPNDRSIMEKGWSRAQLGTVIRTLGDGLYVGEYFDGVKRMDIILRAETWDTPEELGTMPMFTPGAGIVPLAELVKIDRTVGPDQIRRVDRKRTITLSVTPPETMSLEKAISTIRAEVQPKIEAALPQEGSILYGGSADNLKKAIRTMSENFAMALLILFLLMSALFRSMKDSLLVVLAMPLATVGGVVAMYLLNLVSFQPLDLLTMIGFVILLGLVVNNAILLVHQTRSAEREGLNRHHAVEQALRLRLRPIFMSTLTSIFGMLPLLLIPGEGSVIYRGLAAVIVGGMCVSTLFTLVLLPCFLRMGAHQPVLLPEVEDKKEKEKPRLESVA